MNTLTIAERNGLQVGDVLKGPKSQFKIVEHYVVYLGPDINGRDVYMENNVDDGVKFLFEEDMWEAKYQFSKIRRFYGNGFQRNAAVNRAIQLLGKPYHLTRFNCEHFANYVQYNKSFSTQSGNGLAIAATFLTGLALWNFLDER